MAGDALDLVDARCRPAQGDNRLGTAIAIGAVGGVTLADIATAQMLSAGDGNDEADEAAGSGVWATCRTPAVPSSAVMSTQFGTRRAE